MTTKHILTLLERSVDQKEKYFQPPGIQPKVIPDRDRMFHNFIVGHAPRKLGSKTKGSKKVYSKIDDELVNSYLGEGKLKDLLKVLEKSVKTKLTEVTYIKVGIENSPLTYNKETRTFYGNEKNIRFDMTYIIKNEKTKQEKEFDFKNSTGPEFDPNTKWIYKSTDGFTLEISNDEETTKRSGDAYLKAKTRR